MTASERRLPDNYRGGEAPHADDFVVSELAAVHAGSQSPFGDDIQFPLPLDKVRYTHPTAADRPNLAGG